MADTKFNCPHCNQSLEAPPEMRGEIIGCPSCQELLEIPRPIPAVTPISGRDTTALHNPSNNSTSRSGVHSSPDNIDTQNSFTRDKSFKRAALAILLLGYTCLSYSCIAWNTYVNKEVAKSAAQAGVSAEDVWTVMEAINANLPISVPALILAGVAFIMGLTAAIMRRYVAGPILIILAIFFFFMFMNMI